MRVSKEPYVSEAVCEIVFADEQSWDWTIPGLLYARLMHEFPKRREQRLGKGEPVRIVFLREDERVLIQVGVNALTITHGAPYSGWEFFRAAIERALTAYLQAASAAPIHSVSLRYVYHLPAPSPAPLRIEGFQDLPTQFTRAPQHWSHQLTIPYADTAEILTIQSETAAKSNGSEPRTQLTVTLTRELGAASRETCLQWLDRAHATVAAFGEVSMKAPARIRRAPFVLDRQAFPTGTADEFSLPLPTQIHATARLHKVVHAPFQFIDDTACIWRRRSLGSSCVSVYPNRFSCPSRSLTASETQVR
jgi:uncharacterized protein (TIGR04255 family)